MANVVWGKSLNGSRYSSDRYRCRLGERRCGQDVAAGEAAFRKCQVCHDLGETARSKLGPPLNGLDGRKAGSIEGYDYSDANKNSGITWTEATFKEHLPDPSARIPGTKMIFSDKNEKEIADLWAYLNSGRMGRRNSGWQASQSLRLAHPGLVVRARIAAGRRPHMILTFVSRWYALGFMGFCAITS